MPDQRNLNLGTTLLGAFLVTFLVVGVPFWSIPYAKVSLPGSLTGLGGTVAFLAAAALCWFAGAPLARAVIVAGSAIPAVVMARVMTETSRDPTTHNLWPFELVIAGGIGLIAALAGGILGRWLARATGREPRRN